MFPKYPLCDLPFSLATMVLRSIKRDHAPLVLMYHSVSDTFMRGMPTGYFKSQMAIIRKEFSPVSLDRIIDYVKTGVHLPGKAVAITFDDGFRDNYLNAYPILAEYGIPFTVFVTTSFIDGKVKSYPERFGSPAGLLVRDISRIAQSHLATIGSHAVTHRLVPSLEEKELRLEIAASKRRLEDITDRPVKYFAFPGSSCSLEARKIVEDCGYLGGLCGEARFVSSSDDVYHIPRVGVSRYLDDSSTFFRARLQGGFHLLKLIKRISSGLKSRAVRSGVGTLNDKNLKKCQTKVR